MTISNMSGQARTYRDRFPRQAGGYVRHGFTLLEVILAMVLVVGLVAVVLVFYHRVLHVRQITLDQAQATEAQRMVMRQITADLTCALNEPGIGQVLEGQSDSLRFLTTRVPGPTAWLNRDQSSLLASGAENQPAVAPGADPSPEGSSDSSDSVTDSQTAPILSPADQAKQAAEMAQDDVQVVNYALDAGEDADGQPVVNGLDRGVQTLVMAKQVEEGVTLHTRLITSDIRFMAFRYFDGTTWQTSWQEGKLPAAVEVTLGEQPLPEGTQPEDYPYTIARRVIAIPTGVQPTGNVMRGLGRGGL